MSEDQDMMVGSLDSGMGEVLAASLDKLLLDDPENDKNKEEEEEEEEEDAVMEETDKPMRPNGDKRVAFVPIHHPLQFRGMSVSSEDASLTSGAEDREIITGPKTKEERLALLKELLETYFSDNYLTRDIFLLKHFRKSKEGWISLKFMASYKKIKRTAKSRAEVEEAVRMSPRLEMNEEGNKVRRFAPFPACLDEYIPTRMTLIGGLPKQMRNLAALSNLFTHYGEVASLQILRPGVNLPEIILETAINFPELRDQWCAIVEFDEIQAAGQLASDINERKIDNDIGWAMELVMPWKNRKNSDRQQDKPLWTESIKNRSLSSPSSGYSSPACLTPEQSPRGVTGRNVDIRSLSKRERIMMDRTYQTSCWHHSHYSTSNSSSPTSQKIYHRSQQRQQQGGAGYRSPKRPSSQLTAETCDNWRSSAPVAY